VCRSCSYCTNSEKRFVSHLDVCALSSHEGSQTGENSNIIGEIKDEADVESDPTSLVVVEVSDDVKINAINTESSQTQQDVVEITEEIVLSEQVIEMPSDDNIKIHYDSDHGALLIGHVVKDADATISLVSENITPAEDVKQEAVTEVYMIIPSSEELADPNNTCFLKTRKK
jgi:hypothetical protein